MEWARELALDGILGYGLSLSMYAGCGAFLAYTFQSLNMVQEEAVAYYLQTY